MAALFSQLWNVCIEGGLLLTFKGSYRSGLCAVIGGFLGALAGKSVVLPGAIFGAAFAESTGFVFKPLWNVITEMPIVAKQGLLEKIMEILQQAYLQENITTLGGIAIGVAANLKSKVSSAVTAFY